MTGPDPRQHLLPEAQARVIFDQEISPFELDHAVARAEPTVVFVVGQPGSPVAETADTIRSQLTDGALTGPVVLNRDDLRPYHPEYSRLVNHDGRLLDDCTDADAARWQAAAERHTIDRRYDAVVQVDARRPTELTTSINTFRRAGYRVEVALVATPEPVSRLAELRQFRSQLDLLGRGRLTSRADHETAASTVGKLAGIIETAHTADVVTVLGPGNKQLYLNYLIDDGSWRWPAGAAAAVHAEQTRSWTRDETRAATTALAKLATSTVSRAELATIQEQIDQSAHPTVPPPAPQMAATQRLAALQALAFPTSTRDALAAAEHASPGPTPSAAAVQPERTPRADEAGR